MISCHIYQILCCDLLTFWTSRDTLEPTVWRVICSTRWDLICFDHNTDEDFHLCTYWNYFKPLITTLFFICVSQSYLLTALYVLTKPIICQLCRNNIFLYIRDKGLITDLTIGLIRTTDLDCMMKGSSETTSIKKLNF